MLLRNDAGQIYGLTFIDHKLWTVFNGSDLGKAYSAKAMVKRFSDRDEPRVYLGKEPSSDYLERNLGLGARRGKGEDGLLDGLLAKADYNDLTVIRKKRRKKGWGTGAKILK